MKKLLTFLAIISCTTIFAHTLTKQCWTNNRYNIQASLGDANGKIEVTTYTNSTRTVLVEATQTYFLNNSGATLFSVLQPQQNTQVFVYVRWFYKQGSNYLPTSWNSGQGYPNSYSSTNTGSNACSVVAVENYNISPKLNGNELSVILPKATYKEAYFQYSKDGVKFREFKIINNNYLFLLDEGNTFVRVKYIVNNKVVYSNTVKVFFTDYSINFSQPYTLYVFDQTGKLVDTLNNKTHLNLHLARGIYYLKYWQIKNNIELIKIVKFIKI